MLTLKLPDGSSKQYPEGTRPRDVAESIGKRLSPPQLLAQHDVDTAGLVGRQAQAFSYEVAHPLVGHRPS